MLISVLLSASSNFSSGLLPERQPVFTNPVNPAEKPANRRSGQFARKAECCRVWRKIGGAGIFPDVQNQARGRTTAQPEMTSWLGYPDSQTLPFAIPLRCAISLPENLNEDVFGAESSENAQKSFKIGRDQITLDSA